MLINTKHELLAQGLARGLSMVLAARKAGYLTTSPAYEVRKLPEVQDRIQELLEIAADETVMEAREVLVTLSTIARADVRELIDMDEPDHVKILHPSKWTNEASRLIAGIKQTKDGIEYKLVSQMDALDRLARIHGLYKDNLSLTGGDGGPIQQITSDMSPEMAAQFYQMTLGK